MAAQSSSSGPAQSSSGYPLPEDIEETRLRILQLQASCATKWDQERDRIVNSPGEFRDNMRRIEFVWDNVLWRDKAKDITVVRAFLKDTEEKNREEDRKLKNKEGVKDLRGKAEQGR
ncbi:MAG: hypothetical protein L6R42_004550 [Xanthoria sp. 1 TBL-2021]|nr:MAG: hypothetical protein L6R42_004550 [Xanthoria sp. 1 TBL-2021]